MGFLPRDGLERSAVTKQPCHIELVRLLDMVNPTTSDWPPSPRTDDYCPELQPRDTSILGTFRATVSSVLGDCLGKEVWLQGLNMCSPRKPVKSTKPARKQQQALWRSLHRFFGKEDGKKVKFNSVPQVRIIESKGQLYPPTLEGAKIKREAFWTPWEIEVNQVRWYAHVDGKYAASGYKCDCLGCQLEADIHDEKVFDVMTSKRENLHVPEDIPAMDAVSEVYLY